MVEIDPVKFTLDHPDDGSRPHYGVDKGDIAEDEQALCISMAIDLRDGYSQDMSMHDYNVQTLDSNQTISMVTAQTKAHHLESMVKTSLNQLDEEAYQRLGIKKLDPIDEILMKAGKGNDLESKVESDSARNKRLTEEERIKAEVEARLQAAEEERLRVEAEAKRKAEEEKKRKEEEKKKADIEKARKEAEARLKAEEEKAKKEAEAAAKRKAEAEAQKKAEAEERRKADEEEQRKADEKKKREAEAEAKRKAEEDANKKAQEEAKKKADAEAEAKKKADEEAKRIAEEQKKVDELMQQKTSEESERKRQEEERKRLMEAFSVDIVDPVETGMDFQDEDIKFEDFLHKNCKEFKLHGACNHMNQIFAFVATNPSEEALHRKLEEAKLKAEAVAKQKAEEEAKRKLEEE